MIPQADPAEVGANWPKVVVIVGPTAVGKSKLALRLAEALHADVVTADSRQVYRYMDIGTAKPTLSERSRVRHYMLDLVAPDETYSAQCFRLEGLQVLRRIAAEGRVALVVGGTGFYVRGLLDGPAVAPVAPDHELRSRLRAQLEEQGAAALHQRLAELDPTSARRVHPNNTPRLIRALEVIEKTGGPVSRVASTPPIPALYLGLTRDRPALWEIADRRVVAQIEAGLIEETRSLLAMGYRAESTAMDGFGYRQAIAFLTGRQSLDNAIAEYQTATRQYIRRQTTWFRADKRIQWLDTEEDPFTRALGVATEYCFTAESGVRQ